jgi:CRP/FNR family transcriptional regulator, cyclic AMP receptor protein
MSSSPELEILSTSPLMHGMGEEELKALLSTTERRLYEAGERIIEEGAPSDCLFILADGAVDVVKGMGDEAVMLSTLDESGDFFGEMSLIDTLPRSANVLACGQTRILAFPKKVLTTVFSKMPRVQMTLVLNIARNLSLRLREADLRIADISREANASSGGSVKSG